ncbi:hypothetical protein HG530_006127 [Fusarium avenaceum]|nr:hypothetical protein HG530_006127 [Fusarium avenaceum]
MRGISNQLGILCQHTSLDPGFRGLPLTSPSLHLLVSDIHSDRTSNHSLRHDVAHDEAVRSSTVSSVRDEGQVRETGTHDGCRSLELFRHSGAALGAFVSDNDNQVAVGLLDLAICQGGIKLLFSVEYAGLASECQTLFSCDLSHGTARSKVALQNANVAGLFDGVLKRTDDILTGIQARPVFDVLCKGLASDGHDATVEKAASDKHLDH